LTFPVYFHLFGFQIHPHPVMELLAYATGFGLHTWIRHRRKMLDTQHAIERNMWIIVGAIFGALIGAKLLAWIESAKEYEQHFQELAAWMGGKTIVGGLVGGWIGVEIAKKCLGLRRSVGDSWVFPLCISMAIGRVGCFLTGLDDHTYGNFTNLPWAVNFGDGPRHPTQLYDIVFLLLLAAGLWAIRRRVAEGILFRVFMLAYCTYRFLIEFIKPTDKPFAGVSAIQAVCLITTAFCVWSVIARSRMATHQLTMPVMEGGVRDAASPVEGNL
jgi:prolipoprotein diacylglyceryltransferase